MNANALMAFTRSLRRCIDRHIRCLYQQVSSNAMVTHSDPVFGPTSHKAAKSPDEDIPTCGNAGHRPLAQIAAGSQPFDQPQRTYRIGTSK